MHHLSLKKQMIITTASVIIITVLISILVVIPRIYAIIDIRETIVERQRQVEQQHSQSKQLRRSLAELSQSLAIAKEISQSTITGGRELELIKELELLSERHHITQNLNVAVKEVPKGSPFISQKITSYYELSFLNHGTFQDQMNFLADLEVLPFYITIDTLQWEINSAKQEQGQITLRFDGKVYIYNP